MTCAKTPQADQGTAETRTPNLLLLAQLFTMPNLRPSHRIREWLSGRSSWNRNQRQNGKNKENEFFELGTMPDVFTYFNFHLILSKIP